MTRSIDDHVRFLGIATIVYHGFVLLALFVIIPILVGAGLLAGIGNEPDALFGIGVVGVIISGIFVLIALPGIIAGIGLLRERSWGRILTIIVNVLPLFSVPVGTGLAIYTYWVLIQREDELMLE